MKNNYTLFSDRDLCVLLNQGNEAAYNEIYNRYKVVLFIHAYKLTQNEDEAKDILQELFMGLWMKRKELIITTSLSSYLYTSIKNRILDRIAHANVAYKYVESIQNYIHQGQCLTDETLREKELRLIIEKGVEDLPPKMKEVYELSREHNFSHKQIAQKLNISENTVKKHVYNALKILRLRINSIFLLF